MPYVDQAKRIEKVDQVYLPGTPYLDIFGLVCGNTCRTLNFFNVFFIFVPTNPWRFHANVVFFERVFGKSGTILCQDAQAQFLAPGTEVDVEEGREAPRWGHTQLPVNQTWLAGKSDHFHRNFRTQKLRHQWQHPFPLFTCSQSHSRGEKRSLEWWRCGSSLQLQTQRS